MARTKQRARKNQFFETYNVLNKPSSDLKRIYSDKKEKEKLESIVLSFENSPTDTIHEESKLLRLSKSELIDIILKKQKDNERTQLLFFKVFRNVYIKKKIFSYLPIFVSTIHSMICYGSTHWCGPSESIIDKDTYDCFIILTKSKQSQIGSAWTRYPISMEQDFIVSFQFKMEFEGADGIALVFLSSPHLSNTNELIAGGQLAYNGYSNGIFAVEFDTHENDENNDPNDNHCSIQGLDKEGILSSHHDYSLGCFMPSFRLHDGLVHNVKLYFCHENSSVSVELDSNIILSNVIIPKNMKGPIKQSYIGFTSSTGSSHQQHTISNFRILKQ